ncbi:MAG: DUF1289 domain-containing protein [Candidatus Kapabacteria bacterium]|nr:DUF1289 domain-containing protein [Candidatus Kapabacteria bacterium]
MPTPCIQVCQIDQITGLCTGCHRTRNEVARWGAMSNHERLNIMAELPIRKSTVRQHSVSHRTA